MSAADAVAAPVRPSRWWWLVLVPAVAWAAVDLVLGAVVAPAPFALAKDAVLTTDQAGQVFGLVLVRWNLPAWGLAVLVAAGLLAIALGSLKRSVQRWRIAGLIGLALLVLGLRAGCGLITTEGVDLAAQRRQLHAAGTSDPLVEQQFADLHQRSRLWFEGEMLAAAVAAVIAARGLGRRV